MQKIYYDQFIKAYEEDLGKNTLIEGGGNLCFCDESISILTTLDLDENNKQAKNTKQNNKFYILL